MGKHKSFKYKKKSHKEKGSKGHGHPFGKKFESFTTNEKLKKEEDLSLVESFHWSVKLREKALSKYTKHSYKKSWKSLKNGLSS